MTGNRIELTDKNLRGIRQEPACNQTGADKGSVMQTKGQTADKGSDRQTKVRLQTRG